MSLVSPPACEGYDFRFTTKLKSKNGIARKRSATAYVVPDGKVSVKNIPKGDNRGSGSSIGHQLKNLPNGTRVEIKIKKKDGN
jgi:hypothetical protein